LIRNNNHFQTRERIISSIRIHIENQKLAKNYAEDYHRLGHVGSTAEIRELPVVGLVKIITKFQFPAVGGSGSKRSMPNFP